MDVIFDWNLGNMIYNGLITHQLCGFPFAEIRVVSIVHLIKATNALMLVQDESTYQETSYLMKEFFLSVSSIPMPALVYGLKSISFLTCFLPVPP